MFFSDSIKSLYNSIINSRSTSSSNYVASSALDYSTMNMMFKSGLGSKIIRLKAVAALTDTIDFASDDDKILYEKKFASDVKQAAKYMMGFGRGVVLIHNKGEDLSSPMGQLDKDRGIVRVFSGDMITPSNINLDLENERYQKPELYNVWGHSVHHSRIIDFTYVRPVETDLPIYRYGGISEFELIYDQFIADGIIQRAGPAILERSSNWVYKIDGFSAAMRNKQEAAIRETFSAIENMRSIYGATILDSQDSVESLNQQLNGLAETDQIALRRLAMVTGIPLSILIGESVRGLNATGDNELTIYNGTIRDFESEFLLDPINQLCAKCGMSPIKFKKDQGQTPIDSASYESLIIDNAVKLASVGEDYESYLSSNGLISEAEYDDFFNAKGDSADGDDESDMTGQIDPSASLNGAQIASMLSVIEQVATGLIPKTTAAIIMATAFPMSIDAANDLLKDVEEGSIAIQEKEETKNNTGNTDGQDGGAQNVKGSIGNDGVDGEGLV